MVPFSSINQVARFDACKDVVILEDTQFVSSGKAVLYIRNTPVVRGARHCKLVTGALSCWRCLVQAGGNERAASEHSSARGTRHYRGQRVETPSHPGGVDKDAAQAIRDRGVARRDKDAVNTRDAREADRHVRETPQREGDEERERPHGGSSRDRGREDDRGRDRDRDRENRGRDQDRGRDGRSHSERPRSEYRESR